MKNIRKFDEFKNENYVAEPESWSNLSSMFSGILDKGKEALKKGKEGFEEALEKGKDAVSDVADGAEDMFDDAIDTVKGWFGIPKKGGSLQAAVDDNNLIFADKIALMLPDDKDQRAFKAAIMAVCKRLGIKTNWLLWIIWKESEFVPTAKNDKSTASGLMQLIDERAREAGTTAIALRGMSPIQQLPYIEKYLRIVGANRCRSVEDLYVLVFAPGRWDKRHDRNKKTVNVSKNGGNAGVDTNKDGEISMGEFLDYSTHGMPQAYKNLC